MINNYLATQIKTNFPFHPTVEQEISIEKLSEFIFSPDDRAVFVLCGYAGTGKTTLVSALVRTLTALQRKCVLLAPTGRAAKVFASYSEKGAFTIHKWIYRQKSIVSNTFTLSENLSKNALFIVDEASMIANGGMSGFGSGALLDDLVEFVYSGDGCRLLLLGDTAQLPPVGEELSPALSPDYLRSMYLNVMQMELTQVMRQSEDSGILSNATMLRRIIASGSTDALPNIRLKGFPDISIVTGENLIESIETEFGNVGIEETIILCRSNKRANIYNEGIRRRILYREEELNRGDLLMVVKNNYYWREQIGKVDKELLEKIDFIANGDIAEIIRVGGSEDMYGFRFADVTLSFPDYDCEMEVKIILDTLTSESPSLTRDENERLFSAVWEDYSEIGSKRKRMEKLREDPYYNAMQVKYGYAVTCHKAQGGQWKTVFLDQGFIAPDGIGTDYYRWLYTAFTRASEKLYLVNWPTKNSDSRVE
ncbi:MAG: AAA family ATPase [Bacteroidaceae bacterium]|nr:AAA family ATPase [Bacteroidaceae bacterium]